MVDFSCRKEWTLTTSYKQHFDKLNIEGFDFRDGWRNKDIPKLKFEKYSDLKVFDVNVKNGALKLLALHISESNRANPIDSFWFTNQFYFIKKFYEILGTLNKHCVYGNCPTSFHKEDWIFMHQINSLKNEPCLLKFAQEDWPPFTATKLTSSSLFMLILSF